MEPVSHRPSDRRYAQCILSLVIAAAIGVLIKWIVDANFEDPGGESNWHIIVAFLLTGMTTAPVSFPVIAGCLWATGLLRAQWSKWEAGVNSAETAFSYARHLAVALAVMTPVYYSIALLLVASSVPPRIFGLVFLTIILGFALFSCLGLIGLWTASILSGVLRRGIRTSRQEIGVPTACCTVFLTQFYLVTFLLPYAVWSLVEGNWAIAHIVTVSFVLALIGLAFALQPKAAQI